ncbi:MAG: hypothetical protein NUW01_11360, partial [Gemmatimonadaceae bacterium]|nr:hypothetical protein [Gemmatimonadaceae bacterium]
YEFACQTGHLSEELRPVGTTTIVCRCGADATRRPSRFSLGNPPTGAGLRSHFSLFQEASQEMGHAYSKAESDLERSIPAPDLWGQAKTRAKTMIAAGEAPPPRPLG